MSGAPKLDRVGPIAAALVLAGAAVLAVSRAPVELRHAPECADVAECRSRCDEGFSWACYELGGLLDEGAGAPKSPHEAVSLWKGACDAGHGNACFQLAELSEHGGNGMPKDAAAAESYRAKMAAAFEAECAQGLARSCLGLARSLEDGVGIAPDGARAVQLYSRVKRFWEAACAGGEARACGDAAALHAAGIGTPEDAARALELNEKACSLGRGVACELAGFQAKARQDTELARDLLTKACELDVSSACEGAAELTDDHEAKVALFKRRAARYGELCEAGHVHACWVAANTFVDKASFLPRDGEQALVFKKREMELREKGCNQGAAAECVSLALTLQMGKLVKRDPVKAQSLMARACDLGDGSACETKRQALDDVVDMSVGYHTCVVKGDGSVWCWGQNRDGQLGDGTKEDRDRPVRAQGVPKAAAVDLYGGTTCIRTLDNQAWCWGAGFSKATRVDGGEPVQDVATGYDLACALRENGDVGCSGHEANNYTLGASAVRAGGLARCAIAKGKLMCWGGVLQKFLEEPTAVLPNDDVVDASVTSDGFCALFKDGNAECQARVLEAEPVRRLKLEGVRLVGGDADAGCAMRGDELWCWHLHERRIKKPSLVRKLTGVKKLVIRSFEGCALTNDKKLYCWYALNPDPELVSFQRGPSAKPPAAPNP